MTALLFAKGSSGGHASASHSSTSGSRSSTSSKSSSSKPSSSSKSTSTSKPATGKSTAKPGSTVKVGGKTVKSSTAKPTSSKYSKVGGVVGDNGYSPRFSGYSAPPGSVVYYHDYNFSNYLLWAYLFSSHSPATQTTTVVQPDGKQVVAEPQRGTDGMAIFNWILLVLLALAVIGGIVWLVNKHTSGERHGKDA